MVTHSKKYTSGNFVRIFGTVCALGKKAKKNIFEKAQIQLKDFENNDKSVFFDYK